MKLVADLLQKAEASAQNLDETALLLCQAAENLEQLTNYEEAAQALARFWTGLGERPRAEGLKLEAKANLLLRVGVLTGLLGNIAKREESQSAAKDLICEAQTLFREAGDTEKALTAQVDLALCYWREGAFDEARLFATENLDVIANLPKPLPKVQVSTLLLLAAIEQSATRYQSALDYLAVARPLVKILKDHGFSARLHNQAAITYRLLAQSEETQSFSALARLRLAARGLSEVAPVSSEQTPSPQTTAEKTTGANASAPSLENLITEVANRCRKPLTFTHEALATARKHFLKDNLQTWQKLLEHTAEIASSKVTISEQAVRIVALRQIADANFLHPWENFVLRDWTHAAEHEFIEMALREAGGKISVAANLLGFDHYESLNSMIKSRHKDLLEVRTKPIPRRRSIIKIKRKRQ